MRRIGQSFAVVSCWLVALGLSASDVAAQAPGRVLTNSGSAFGGLIAFNVDGTNTINLTSNTFDGGDGALRSLSDHPSVSSNGLIAFESNRDGTGYRIFTIKTDGTGLRQVTTDAGVAVRDGTKATDRYPVISPDGTKIAFLSNRYSFGLNESFYDIYVVNVDGTGLEKVSTTERIQRAGSDPPYYDSSNNRSVVWSPDSTQLAFRGSRYLKLTSDANPAFWEMIGKITVATKTESFFAFTLDCGTGSAIDWSVDGKIAYSYGGAIQGCGQYYPKFIILASSGNSEISSDALGAASNGNGGLRFSPDGQRIMYFDSLAHGTKGAVSLINVNGSGKTVLPYATGINDVYGAPLWWMAGDAIPTPAAFRLSPNPALVAYGGAPLQMSGTLYDANGGVIVNAATGWRWNASGLTVTPHGLASATSTDGRTDQLCANNAGVESCVTFRSNSGEVTSTAGGSISTRTGSSIAVRPSSDTSVTFANVTTAGITSAMPTNATAAGTLPTGYLPTTVAYDISSTAVVSGSHTVCLQAPSSTDATTFARMRVMHAESGALVDRTILSPSTPAPDFTTKMVCASVGSLSPFTMATINVAPTISTVANQSINEDSATANLAVSIADAETAAASLTLTGSSSNTRLVPSSGITFGGSGGSRTVRVTPAANESGIATITLTVADPNGGSATTTFTVSVAVVNDAPTIASMSDLSIPQGTSTSALAVTIDDLETAAGSLTLGAASSNTSLVPTSAIALGGSGSARTATITPDRSLTGSSTITLTVTDAAGATATTSFVLTVTAAAPDAPSGLSASASGSLVQLTWVAPTTGAPVTGYVVEAGVLPAATSTSVTTGSTSTSFALTLSTVGRWYVRVRATNTAGSSAPSNEVSVTTSGVTSNPRDLAFSLSGSTATFTWLAPLAGTPTGYVLEAGSASGSSNLGVLPTGSTATSISIGVPTGTFFVRVRADNSAGRSDPSNEVTVTYPTAPAAPGVPRSFAASAVGNSLTASWLAPSSGGAVDTYVLEAGSSSGARDVFNGAVGNVLTLTSPVPNGTYFLRVRARNSVATSGPSEEVRVVVGAPPQLPSAPMSLASSMTGSTLSITWFAPASGDAPTGYVIDVGSESGQSNVIQLAIGPTTTFSIANPPSGRYFVRVRAINAAGSSPPSNELTITVP